MNHYIYFVGGEIAEHYLGGTNYVRVWADSQLEATRKVVKYFAKGTVIIPTSKENVNGQLGYLY